MPIPTPPSPRASNPSSGALTTPLRSACRRAAHIWTRSFDEPGSSSHAHLTPAQAEAVHAAVHRDGEVGPACCPSHKRRHLRGAGRRATSLSGSHSAQLVPPPHRSFSSSVPPESAARPVSQPTRAGFTDADDDLVDSSGSVTAPRQGVRRSIVGPLGGRGLASLRSFRGLLRSFTDAFLDPIGRRSHPSYTHTTHRRRAPGAGRPSHTRTSYITP
ncbi:hypothetical protein AcV7_007542 [Taiwanofungus camphoratus]|nr:hypothetical protein AcV7_007542 [Antrodia cinnamomea]